jgi:hypothetical protein
VELLRGGLDEGRAEVVRALCSRMAGKDANKAAVAQAGAIPLLVFFATIQ